MGGGESLGVGWSCALDVGAIRDITIAQLHNLMCN